MADKEFTQICKEILGIGKRLEKIEPEELIKIKTDVEKMSEAISANKASFEASKEDFNGKYSGVIEIIKTFDALRSQIEEVLKNGTINDSVEALIPTFLSKKIMDLFYKEKGSTDEKFSTIYRNGITPWSSSLEYPAGAISVFDGKLYQAKSQNINKNPNENKETWCVLASEEWSDDKFALKSQITTGYFEPYNKVFLDSIKIEGLKDILNVIDPFEDGSGVALYTFEEGGNEINRLNTYSNGNSRFGTRCVSATEQRDAGTKLQDSEKQAFAGDFTISMWINPSSVVTNASHNFHRFLSLQLGFTAFLFDNNTRFNINVGTNSSWYEDNAFLQSVASAGIKLDEWNHFVLYRKNGKIKIIINRKELPQSITSNTDFSKNIHYLCVAGDIQLSSGLTTQPFAGYVDQVRIFNRALIQKEVDALALEKRFDTSSPNSIVCQGHAYISSGKNQNNLYENNVYAINATLEEKERPNGTYYIKAKADNTLELVEQKPMIGTKSNNSEYYIDGTWFSKNAEKLPLQAYLSYMVDILDNKFIGLRLSNIDANANTSIGVNQTWQDVKSQRLNGVVYTNTTSRPIMILVSQQQSSSSQTCELEINGVRVIKNISYGTADGCIISAVIPVGATYKVIYKNYPPLEWQELR